jgi:hypothetical protein
MLGKTHRQSTGSLANRVFLPTKKKTKKRKKKSLQSKRLGKGPLGYIAAK